MTMKDYTALVLIVDRSGSMDEIATDMEGAIKTLLKEQIAATPAGGKLTVDYVRFDDVVEHVATFADPATVDVTIQPRNMTALNDAVGTTIQKFGDALAGLDEDQRPDTVMVAIVTDGRENASKDYTGQRVREMVEHQTADYQWVFVYLGANQDAIKVAQGMGISAGSALTYDTKNVYAGTQSLSGYTTTLRTTGSAAFTDDDRDANGS